MRMLLLLCAMLLPACQREGAANSTDAAESLRPPTDATGAALFFDQGPVDVGATRAEIVARLGEPDRVTAEAVPNRHDPAVTDSLFHMEYGGLLVDVYRAAWDGREMVVRLQVSSDQHLRPDSPIRMGASEQDVRALLGEPDELSDAGFGYLCDACLVSGREGVDFQFQRGALRRIDLRYWLD